MAAIPEMKWLADSEPDEGGRYHVRPSWGGRHDVNSATCPCGPAYQRACSGCDGEGCGTCGDGWLECGPFDAEIVIHRPIA